ncbi:MAG: ATP-grasp domain-containing protein [Thermodesulfobacteriota bacterium]
MGKPVILVSAVCGDIGCSAVRALRDAAGKIVGCDMNSYSPVLNLIDQFYNAPPASEEERYMSFLREVIKAEDIGFFLPVSDPEIKVLSLRRKEIEILGVKLLLNNRTIIDNFLDKLKTAHFIAGIGLRTPKTALLKDYDGSFGFPLVIKPRIGHGSQRLYKAENSVDLDYARSKDDGLLIAQECIGSESDEYTTGVFSDGKRVSSITFKRKLGFGSLTAEAILIESTFLENISEQIAEATHLVGSINIQSRRLNDNFFLPFEINPRLSSTLPFRRRFGFDDAVWWLDVLLGKSYSYKREFKSGRAIRYVSECYFDIERFGHENR